MPLLSSVVKNVQKKRFVAKVPVVTLTPARTAYKTEAVQSRTGGRRSHVRKSCLEWLQWLTEMIVSSTKQSRQGKTAIFGFPGTYSRPFETR